MIANDNRTESMPCKRTFASRVRSFIWWYSYLKLYNVPRLHRIPHCLNGCVGGEVPIGQIERRYG